MKHSAGAQLIHHRKSDTFAITPHAMAEDADLSFKAKGVLLYLLGKPPHWRVQVADICNHGTDGLSAIKSALRELRSAGYIKLEKITECGQIVRWDYHVADSPLFFAPQVGNRPVGNRPLSKNKGSKNEGLKETGVKNTRRETEAVVIPALWKPDTETKSQKLAKLRPPTDLPSETDLYALLDEIQDEDPVSIADQIANYRGELYGDLCRAKWRQWNQKTGRWVKIRDWKKYVRGLIQTIDQARAS